MSSKRKTISSEKKKILIELYEKQHSLCQMANLLELNCSIICWNTNRYKQCGSIENRPRCRRLDKHDSQLCSKLVFHNFTSSSTSRES